MAWRLLAQIICRLSFAPTCLRLLSLPVSTSIHEHCFLIGDPPIKKQHESITPPNLFLQRCDCKRQRQNSSTPSTVVCERFQCQIQIVNSMRHTLSQDRWCSSCHSIPLYNPGRRSSVKEARKDFRPPVPKRCFSGSQSKLLPGVPQRIFHDLPPTQRGSATVA